MADYFSLDLCREILLHLPVKSLIRFKAVSKSWKSLITSRDFIYAHLSNSKTQSLVLDGYGSLLVFAGSIGISPCYEPQFPSIPSYEDLSVVGFTNGLICLSAANLFIPEYSIIIWNPSVHNHVFLKQPILIPERAPPVLGFGVAGHVYKVVCLVPGYHAEVYSLGTGRWRRVEGFEFADKSRVLGLGLQTQLKGVLHWLYCGPGHNTWCLTFEIGDEVFGKVMLPDVLAREEEEVRLSSIEGSLAVVAMKYSPYFADACDVWVMMEYGVKESWIKLYSIDLGNLAKGLNIGVDFCNHEARVIGFRNSEAIIAFDWMKLVSYNLKTGKANDLGISVLYPSFYIDDYVESLLAHTECSG